MIDPLPSDIFQRDQVLNNTYEIEGVLGRGGTGEVYRARNLISGRVVAIKALSKQFSANADYVGLMKREEEMREIVNDAVVRYTECSRTDAGHVFLVMDFIDGPSLAEAMAGRRLDARELMIVGHRVAEGLVAAHARGIVHRDLSPDNVILRGGSAERATIIDFGIAKDTAAGARTIVGNEFAGKYEYAAPEQLDGKAEARSDLYALGGTLLAAFRGETPFPGATPGEIVRRKQSPLDTSGVPEPLKGIVDWLAAPDPAARPASAEAARARFEAALKPAGGRARRPATGDREPRRRSRAGWLLLPLALAAAAGGAWFAGLFDRFLTPPLPIAAPYTLSAALGPEGARLSGHAPDPDTAVMLRRAFGAVAGTMPPEEALTLADGMPAPGWAEEAAAILTGLEGLPEWELEVSGLSARLAALAPDAAARDAARARLAARVGEVALALDIAAGPRLLPVAEVQAALDAGATCGPLAPSAAEGGAYPLGATIAVSGDLESATDAEALIAALAPRIGDRTLRFDTQVLNGDLCAIRKVLPDAPSGAVSIAFSQGDSGEANLTGVFHVGQNPVVDVQVPGSIPEGHLWVALVDNTGKVFNLLPNIRQTETRLDRLGTLEGGVRRVRVLHPIADFASNPDLLAMRVSDSDFGKSEVIAILSREELFDIRRPRDESTVSFAEALAEAVAARPGNIAGIAARVLDSRP